MISPQFGRTRLCTPRAFPDVLLSEWFFRCLPVLERSEPPVRHCATLHRAEGRCMP